MFVGEESAACLWVVEVVEANDWAVILVPSSSRGSHCSPIVQLL